MKTKSRRWPVALTLLALLTVNLQISSARAQNLITNGSFELPALAGNGDSYSTDPGFALPGWSWSADNGQTNFILEYGVTAGVPRYLDGHQALCLNGRGVAVSISQTFPTGAGHNYVLTFGLSDVFGTNAPPSNSQLTVGVAGLTRVFSRINDSGYVLKRWAFTAVSNLTTLTFYDTTPPFYRCPFECAAVYYSPFLDAVCVNPGATLVAGTGTAIPGGTGNFSSFPGGPALSANGGAFFATGAGQQGIYSFPSTPIFPNGPLFPGSPVKIADLNSPIPNGSGSFARFTGSGGYPGNPAISFPADPVKGYVAFYGADSGGHDGIYSGFPSAPVKVVADTTTAIPGGAGNFTAFTGNPLYPGNPLISGQRVVFFGAGASGQQGIYSYPADPVFPGNPVKVADTSTAIPGGSGNFTTFTTSAGFPSSPIFSGNSVVFWAGGASGQQGIYEYPSDPIYPSSPIKIADLNAAIPGGTGNFTDFPGDPIYPSSPTISGGNVAFHGSGTAGQQGIYMYPANPIFPNSPIKVADTSTPIPGGSGNFTTFIANGYPSSPLISGQLIAFWAGGSGGQQGIYVSFPSNPLFPSDPIFPTDPIKVIDLADTLDGKTITGLRLGPAGLSGDPLTFAATFSDGSQGVYVVPVVAELFITTVARAGNDLQLAYTAPAGWNYSIQSSTDLVSGVWVTLPGSNVGNGSILETTVTNAFTVPAQFFRVQQGQ